MGEEQGSVFTIEIPGPERKAVKVRFPSDEQWVDRRRRRKVALRGSGEPIQTDYEDVDAEIVAAIRADGGQPEIDPSEAEFILEQMALAEPEEIIREGDRYRIDLRVLAARTAVSVRIPTVKELKGYRRKFTSTQIVGRNRQEITVNLEAAGDLYRKLEPKAEGYNGAQPPLIHQAAVIEALIEEMERPLRRDQGGNFHSGSGPSIPDSTS